MLHIIIESYIIIIPYLHLFEDQAFAFAPDELNGHIMMYK